MTTSQKWKTYDFAAAARELSASEARRFHSISTTLGAAISSRLGAFVSRPISVELETAEVVDFSALARSSSEPPTRAYLARSSEPRGEHVLAISPDLLLALIDALLGSTGPEPRAARSLTPLEDEIADAVLQEVLLAESDVWRLRTPPSVVRHVDDPRLLEIRRPTDAIALATYRVRFGERHAIEGLLQVAIPPGELLLQISSSLEESPPSAQNSAVGASELSIGVDIRSAPLRITDIVALRPGDVIDTGIDAEDPVALQIDDEPVACGQLGQRNGRLTIRIR
jgi:flagellar motor switch protein FliM